MTDYAARVAELLALHGACRWITGDRMPCGAPLPGDPLPANWHAAHLAEVLAAAGLIPTSTEWGVAGRGVTAHSEGFARFMASPGDRILLRAVTDWKDATDG